MTMVGRVVRGAMMGARMALAEGESGWVSVSGAGDFLAGVGAASKAGPRVSATSALGLSPVWACVKGNAETVGSLPISFHEQAADGSTSRIEPDVADVLTRKPNPDQTGMEFWESMCAGLMLQGNAYAERLEIPTRAGRGAPRLVGLRPLANVTPRRRASDNRWEYVVAERGRTEVLPPEKVFHVRGFGAGDGLGLSAIRYGVQSLGAALAADETAAGMFRNGMMPSGVVTANQALKDEQRSALQTIFDRFAGSSKAGKMMLLEAGMTYHQVALKPEDAQLLDTRRFSVEDVCRWFGVPPIVIGHASSGQTMWGTGVEAIMLAWLRMGINPLLRRLETRGAADLLPTRHLIRWDRRAMLQMDSKTLSEFLARLVGCGTMSRDESRDHLGMPRRGGAADDLMAQTAMAPLEQLLKGDTI